jgi:hypothetical protein
MDLMRFVGICLDVQTFCRYIPYWTTGRPGSPCVTRFWDKKKTNNDLIIRSERKIKHFYFVYFLFISLTRKIISEDGGLAIEINQKIKING